MEFEQLLPYCITQQESDKLRLVIKHQGNIAKAVAESKISDRNFRRSLKCIRLRASRSAPSPQDGVPRAILPGFDIKRISSNYNFVDSDGEVRQSWVIQEPNKADQLALMQQGIEDAFASYKGLCGKVLSPKHTSSDFLHVIPIGDPHVGMYSWRNETGEDFDVEIARSDLLAGVMMLMNAAPACDECLIVNLGDYFHADNSENRTMRSGHALDVDTRYARVVDLGMRLMIDIVDAARNKHKKVRVISLPGNHDDHSGIMLGAALKYIYMKDRRVTIDESASLFRYMQFGQNLFGFTHGHTVKPAALGEIMAQDMKKEWGETHYRYWHTGHIHSNNSMDCRGWRWESHRTLAAQDAWATGAGYRSGRDIKGIVYHREYGEVNRATYDIRAIRGMR